MAWTRLVEIAAIHLKSKELAVVYGALDDQREEDVDRGMCQAIKLFLSMPDLIIETSMETIEQAKLKEEADDGEQE